MSEKKQTLLLKIDSFPEKPGVYLFKDNENKIIYIGKAKILRNRVKSYFAKIANDRKVLKIQQLAYDI